MNQHLVSDRQPDRFRARPKWSAPSTTRLSSNGFALRKACVDRASNPLSLITAGDADGVWRQAGQIRHSPGTSTSGPTHATSLLLAGALRLRCVAQLTTSWLWRDYQPAPGFRWKARLAMGRGGSMEKPHAPTRPQMNAAHTCAVESMGHAPAVDWSAGMTASAAHEASA